MKKVYFAISYSNRKYFDKEVDSLKTFFRKNNIELFVFVDTYNFKASQEKEMMEIAFKEIDSSDFFIAELSTKSIGVGIEVGYAFAKGTPILYLRKNNSEYSTTASGSSKYRITYANEIDLIASVKKMLKAEVVAKKS